MSTNQELKSDALMEQMKQHLSSDAGKQLTKKINLVYQINIAPKVPTTFLALIQFLFLLLLYTQFCSYLNSLFFFFLGSIVETRIQWGCLYRWSEERRGHQRLGILISDFWICFFVVLNWLIILQTWIVRYCELVIALDDKKY